LRAWGEAVRVFCRPVSGVPDLVRWVERRVDLRDGLVRESSSIAVIPAAERLLLRRAVEPPPARRSDALVPGRAEST
jgi:hypothetical protein